MWLWCIWGYVYLVFSIYTRYLVVFAPLDYSACHWRMHWHLCQYSNTVCWRERQWWLPWQHFTKIAVNLEQCPVYWWPLNTERYMYLILKPLLFLLKCVCVCTCVRVWVRVCARMYIWQYCIPIQMSVSAVPVFICASGLCDVQYTITVACRDAFIYTYKKWATFSQFYSIPPLIDLCPKGKHWTQVPVCTWCPGMWSGASWQKLSDWIIQ